GTTSPSNLLSVEGQNSIGSLGSEMISSPTDQGFTSTSTSWTTGAPPWKIDIAGSNKAVKDAPGTGNLTLPNGALTAAPIAGQTYQIQFDFTTTASSSGSLATTFGGTANAPLGQDV